MAGVRVAQDVPKPEEGAAHVPGPGKGRGRKPGRYARQASLAPDLGYVANVRRVIVILAAAASLLAVPAAASAQTLYGSIQGGVIGLRDAAGNPVTQVAAGTYTFEVTDTDTIHNFHLLGTSVDTPIDGTGTFTYTGVTLSQGTHTYLCDIHPEINGTLVVNSPTTGPPAAIAGVTVGRVRGIRLVGVSLQVARPAKMRAQLLRRGRIVAGTRANLPPGRRVARIRVPRSAPRGLYVVRVFLTDVASGERFILRRAVRIRLRP
jgi:plastocyanin